MENREVVVEQDGIWWWVIANGNKIARTTDKRVSERMAREFLATGEIESDE
jgi:hypothetical protein